MRACVRARVCVVSVNMQVCEACMCPVFKYYSLYFVFCYVIHPHSHTPNTTTIISNMFRSITNALICTALFSRVVVSPDFDLVFHRASTTDYVLLRTMPTLHALSVCLWLRTNDSTNYGTILSYAAESNWLTASDVNVFTLYDYGRLRVSGHGHGNNYLRPVHTSN